jgi:hypothetical protein
LIDFIFVHTGDIVVESFQEGKKFHVDGNSFWFKGDKTPTHTLRSLVGYLMPQDHFPARSASDLLMCEDRLKSNSIISNVWVSPRFTHNSFVMILFQWEV